MSDKKQTIYHVPYFGWDGGESNSVGDLHLHIGSLEVQLSTCFYIKNEQFDDADIKTVRWKAKDLQIGRRVLAQDIVSKA
jgi:hypothetical protein